MRRSKWKSLYVNSDNQNFNNLKKPNKSLRLMSRNSSITPKFLKLTVYIHNGKNFKKLTITEEMLGHKFGEFAKTRTDFEFKKKKKKN